MILPSLLFREPNHKFLKTGHGQTAEKAPKRANSGAPYNRWIACHNYTSASV